MSVTLSSLVLDLTFWPAGLGRALFEVSDGCSYAAPPSYAHKE